MFQRHRGVQQLPVLLVRKVRVQKFSRFSQEVKIIESNRQTTESYSPSLHATDSNVNVNVTSAVRYLALIFVHVFACMNCIQVWVQNSNLLTNVLVSMLTVPAPQQASRSPHCPFTHTAFHMWSEGLSASLCPGHCPMPLLYPLTSSHWMPTSLQNTQRANKFQLSSDHTSGKL